MKKFLIGLFIFFILLGAAALYLNTYLKNQLQEILENDLPASISLDYENINIDSWGGNASMTNATVRIKANDSMPRSEVKNASVQLRGLNHWDYFKNKNIHFKNISIHADSLTHYSNRNKKKEENKKQKDSTSENPISAQNMDRHFLIEKFDLVTDYIQIINPKTDSVNLKTAHFNLKLKNITPSISGAITRPFDYEEILMSYDSLYYQTNQYDVLTVGHVEWNGTDLEMNDTRLKTQYSRNQLSKMIEKERDHMDFSIKNIKIHNLKYGEESGEFYINTPLLELEQPSLNIYRDKRIADDLTKKPLYSKMLRELNFEMMIDTIKIKNGGIVYHEKVNSATEAGMLDFSNLNASLYNVGNTYELGEKKTTIAIKAIFMKSSPMSLDWNFDINDPQDKFYVKGSLSKFPVANLESFTSPNLGVEMSGKLEHTYFTIYGNNYSSHIDMQMTYDEFKVNIMNQEKKKKKWFASTIANIFIAKTTKNEDGGFKEGSGEVNRDQTKSFFNYLWLNLREGMLKTVTVLD
ncbi:hypothetical protein [Leeuwenhoekiella marinoflava]|uniref:DUF748 domain-containing protein n=2 Tax=Leeuwenhoekiella marinoflava TaxID=988 RepID=A0A4V1KRI8_9FLAO|nr:hypothetical protein [Leeuwenhoekiella marinoflava]RXG25062.1 hypothetical protein DSL99_3651 [Leeuwenhoekiella marinoflava]SHF90179.1 hypothetical protein SAMN02745246_03678 [Leeuwenhoekiella marinoflava DSM 3653]